MADGASSLMHGPESTVPYPASDILDAGFRIQDLGSGDQGSNPLAPRITMHIDSWDRVMYLRELSI
jgi:hypothetical protein